MSRQISDIASWVAVSKMKRPELLEDAVLATRDFHLLLCSKVPFEALQCPPVTVDCVVGVDTYSLANFSPEVAGLVSVRIAYSSTSGCRLRRSNVRAYDAIPYRANGRPTSYARWGNSLVLDRPPDSALYDLIVRYWSKPSLPDSDIGDYVLTTPEEWDELHRWEVLWRMYTFTEQHEKAMALVQPAVMPRQASPKKTLMHEVGIIPRLWNDLLLTISQRENIDEDFGINPVIRDYTWR